SVRPVPSRFPVLRPLGGLGAGLVRRRAGGALRVVLVHHVSPRPALLLGVAVLIGLTHVVALPPGLLTFWHFKLLCGHHHCGGHACIRDCDWDCDCPCDGSGICSSSSPARPSSPVV